ncbi:hypothetical protein QEH48_gp115 [Streptomyces phage TurkishDelight]|uniref:Uncharacterized protein n=1 Tax=Streptomyces phage TurkishDelight TaxID=2793708 RepID=A0A7T0M151_9CAUD|nr:hypothetical protein QEH48_gp115 [Streptomyces phage TurkishDelight]QPL14144.1 hypothetical protein SEA_TURKISHDELIGHT_115 [Streptomyces phage TurkishDelight]
MAAREPEYTVKRTSDGMTVEEGDQLLVDHNLPVTYLGIGSPPWGDDEAGKFYPGQVRVRYSWGAEETVEDIRAGVTVDEV